MTILSLVSDEHLSVHSGGGGGGGRQETGSNA